MTNTEIIQAIRNEIERRKNYISVTHFAEELYSFLDSLESEKPVPNDIDFEQELYNRFGQIKDFTLGMRIGQYFYNLCKEQMMKGAVEADVNIYRDLAEGESWAEFVVAKPPKNLGDKVRIIIVKEGKE